MMILKLTLAVEGVGNGQFSFSDRVETFFTACTTLFRLRDRAADEARDDVDEEEPEERNRRKTKTTKNLRKTKKNQMTRKLIRRHHSPRHQRSPSWLHFSTRGASADQFQVAVTTFP
jgi:hypothetical protein